MPSASDSAKATTLSATGAPPLALFALLLAFRFVNALTLRTFFQPDEFFQSLEPAWQLAFGETSHACITWEWKMLLRSSLHPALFAAVYRVAALLAALGGLSLPARAELLLAAPKLTQAVMAALLDCYTWKLAEKVHGRGSRTALATLALSVCSPWHWFCSTRTLSNCLETTITVIAIYYWPWHWRGTASDSDTRPKDKSQIAQHQHLGSLPELRLSLLLAALACVLRPTNALVWLSVFVPTLWQASKWLRYVLVREILFCGSAVLVCSIMSDRLYYGVWTLPPLRFLYFNIAQSLAVFYGKNRADYYFTEGLPLLLTTALPFAIVGVWQSLGFRNTTVAAPSESAIQRSILQRLAWVSILVTVALSLISHKEVRFLYPILPFLHLIAAKQVSSFLPPHASLSRKAVISILFALNLLLAGYVSQVHQRGVIDVLSYIRHKHETRNGMSEISSTSYDRQISNTTVGFLMPCHSTPWRSHLVHPQIAAWALTCEPPLGVPLSERSTYLDEADEFYIKPGPVAWLRSNMESTDTIRSGGSRSGQFWMMQDPKHKRKYKHEWPQNLVFFEQLEDTLRKHLDGTRYSECWRGFNSHFHDDHRRVGDVIVWCLDGV
ncbi:glycosyltransferase family 22 protein [Cucurbitaria berberidis CBS 394.84]|uniref:Mannosyltransferase n=1 Tax=Cucurbitaria berberidis CBS 394.84 TaxID=1168544 RepID=A0A9P4GRU7_9PLEO|nr:glycosyltransferase family 22 protein [Cucurbitaria berberidis CBS 394.84]KAF1849926.1 glycosyltransferase family 22 protein [Cucurbitaria berberidis CBS 394.84]